MKRSPLFSFAASRASSNCVVLCAAHVSASAVATGLSTSGPHLLGDGARRVARAGERALPSPAAPRPGAPARSRLRAPARARVRAGRGGLLRLAPCAVLLVLRVGVDREPRGVAAGNIKRTFNVSRKRSEARVSGWLERRGGNDEAPHPRELVVEAPQLDCAVVRSGEHARCARVEGDGADAVLRTKTRAALRTCDAASCLHVYCMGLA